jgi:ABC-type multidrug transport system ATPase subunit
VFQGVASADVEKEISVRLSQVGLEGVRNDRVSTFSGGMKRRLSVAIAAVGNPRIVRFFFLAISPGTDPSSAISG